MLLLLDLGNTNLFVGVYRKRSLVCSFRTYSDKTKSSFEYQEILSQFLKNNNLDLDQFEGAILSSVIPSLTRKVALAASSLLNKECKVLGNQLKCGLSIRIDNPQELGSDLVADSVGALTNHADEDLLIVDLGTATKFLYVSKDKVFHGCSIAPGIKVSFESLWKNAAQLTDIDLEAPSKIIGKNSFDSMNSGVVFGHVAMILGLSKAIEKEVNKPLKKIVTGGNAIFVKNLLGNSFSYEPNLILDGLYDIYMKNNKRGN